MTLAAYIIASANEARMLGDLTADEYCRDLDRAFRYLEPHGVAAQNLQRRIDATRAGVPMPGNHPIR